MGKKILIVSMGARGEVGGIEKYLKQQIGLFTKRGHFVYELNVNPNPDSKPLNENHHCVRHSLCGAEGKGGERSRSGFRLFALYRKIAKLADRTIAENKIDAVVVHAISLPLRFRRNVRYFWVQHNDMRAIRNGKLLGFLRKLGLVKFGLNYPNLVVYSERDEQYLRANNLTRPRQNVFPINLATHTHTHTHTHSLDDIGLAKKTQIAFVGRMHNEAKNFTFLNEITAYADSVRKPMEIHVYGEGGDSLIADNPAIVRHGKFVHGDVDAIFEKIKVLLVPSRTEGFGFVIAEALANGTPCVVADTFLNAGYLVNADRGALMDGFDPGDWFRAIERLSNLPQGDYERIAKNCRSFWSERLNPEIFETKWLDLIGD